MMKGLLISIASLYISPLASMYNMYFLYAENQMLLSFYKGTMYKIVVNDYSKLSYLIRFEFKSKSSSYIQLELLHKINTFADDHFICKRFQIKFLKSKEGSAMVQMGDNASCDRAMKNLNGSFIFGNKLMLG